MTRRAVVGDVREMASSVSRQLLLGQRGEQSQQSVERLVGDVGEDREAAGDLVGLGARQRAQGAVEERHEALRSRRPSRAGARLAVVRRRLDDRSASSRHSAEARLERVGLPGSALLGDPLEPAPAVPDDAPGHARTVPARPGRRRSSTRSTRPQSSSSPSASDVARWLSPSASRTSRSVSTPPTRAGSRARAPPTASRSRPAPCRPRRRRTPRARPRTSGHRHGCSWPQGHGGTIAGHSPTLGPKRNG